MKLYTEEQIIEFLETKIIFDSDDLKELTPIELPSDEEIEKFAAQTGIISNSRCFQRGAKYVINKIQGGNK